MLPRALRALALLAVIGAIVMGHAPQRTFAWSAGSPLLPNGSAQGGGYASSVTDSGDTVQVSLSGARPNATYAIFSCLGLIEGYFGCTDHNLPTTIQQIVVAPKGIAPVVVTLVQQGSLQVNAQGSGSTSLSLGAAVYPDIVDSIYNVVQLVDVADATDSYTALDLQSPTPIQQGVNYLYPNGTATVLGQPTFVYAQFPGYGFPIGINVVSGAPFYSTLSVPYGYFGSPYSPYYTVGLCPSGLPPHAVPGFYGQIFFSC